MFYTILLFIGVALLLFILLIFMKQLHISFNVRLLSLVASIGISIATAFMYILFPIGLTIATSIVLILLASLILAARLERESDSQSIQLDLPSIHTSFNQIAVTEESVFPEESSVSLDIEEDSIIVRKQPLVEVGVDESEELMTGRRRRIQDKEES
ncbi:hypothetical protein [Alkalicoccobacillus porphyridii]|uniref:Uncharacterized protein n=1 Tax=Alkalicoccobacillus porphyridii TaxID=2597270 RepID=A0A553ZXW0_9BACI|nr:hypothetical protein [Alkalicoccobacillus porphyridii]TSB46245.1 hypothetical protein FN960_12865 [Alkalicoccobacillus porphyridii]